MKHTLIILFALIICSCSKSKNETAGDAQLQTVGLHAGQNFVLKAYQDSFTINSNSTITTYGETFKIETYAFHNPMLNKDVIGIKSSDKYHEFLPPHSSSAIFDILQDSMYLYYSSYDTSYVLQTIPYTNSNIRTLKLKLY
jgi:hypothetical protein